MEAELCPVWWKYGGCEMMGEHFTSMLILELCKSQCLFMEKTVKFDILVLRKWN